MVMKKFDALCPLHSRNTIKTGEWIPPPTMLPQTTLKLLVLLS